jgi:hypothetical protein
MFEPHPPSLSSLASPFTASGIATRPGGSSTPSPKSPIPPPRQRPTRQDSRDLLPRRRGGRTPPAGRARRPLGESGSQLSDRICDPQLPKPLAFALVQLAGRLCNERGAPNSGSAKKRSLTWSGRNGPSSADPSAAGIPVARSSWRNGLGFASLSAVRASLIPALDT